jgi:DNA end-binding protein Ku
MAKRRTKKPSAAKWRASWKGDVQFGLVRFGVEAINAHSRAGSDIHFHQLHAKCHSRIEYKKVCPIHGEVEQDEIVLGYEYGRGKYIEIDPEELDAMRTKEERSLRIEEFIAADQLDQIYFDGRMYYLTPIGAHDREPYQLVRQALEDDDKIGIGQVVFSGKEQLAAVLPRDNVLAMAMLNYAMELRNPKSLGVGGEADISSKSLRLAKEVVHSMSSAHFSIDDYEDRYRERVKELIDRKRKGKEVVAPEEEEEAPVVNLMDALKKSLHHSNGHAKSASRSPKRRRRAG